MILFSEIFSRAVNLFDDPDIRKNYINNPVKFQQIMRGFLLNGIHYWTYPTGLTDKFKQYSDASGFSEEDQGDGNASYTLTTTPPEGSVFNYYINGVKVQGSYDNGTVTFEQSVATTDT